MRIGIIGVGNIGRSLVLHLSRAGHDIKVANSRGPETIPEEILVNGARPPRETSSGKTQRSSNSISEVAYSGTSGIMYRSGQETEDTGTFYRTTDTSPRKQKMLGVVLSVMPR